MGRSFVASLGLALLSAPTTKAAPWLLGWVLGPTSLVYAESGAAAEKKNPACADGGSAVDAELLLIRPRDQRSKSQPTPGDGRAPCQHRIAAARLILTLLNNSCHCGVSLVGLFGKSALKKGNCLKLRQNSLLELHRLMGSMVPGGGPEAT